MILSNFKVFNASGRLIGIDWGARRTGVAVSDADRSFVFARAPIVSANSGDLINAVLDIVNAEKIVGIVIGLPLRTNGAESETTAMVRAFASELAQRTDVPIMFIDETLSSSAAQEQMGRVRRSDIKEKLDSNAARVILENAIAMMKR
ncbi:MAG: Holliday junction resolvase RuvX [Alphaproteobacteria bacterium]|nr:Holliday junction resolvase RuvX [Alphaproteobacteria bacterium]